MSQNVSLPAPMVAPAGIVPSTFDTMTANAYQIMTGGGDLVKGDDLKLLIGVPFAITNFAFHPSEIKSPITGKFGSYVTASIILADEKRMIKRRINMDALPWDPEETVVINDGSTGFRRQAVQFLHSAGKIRVVKDGESLIVNGKAGDSHFDRSPDEWDDVIEGSMRFDDDGRAHYSIEITDTVMCPRGLRSSEYRNDYTNEGVTFYIA